MEKPRTSHGSGLPKRIRVLFAIIFILVGILGYRTYKYFGQLEIQTNYAVLKKGPGVEYDQISQLKQNQRVTVLKSKYHWMYVETDDEKKGWVADWMINSSYKLPVTDLSNATIVIDPGHGGYDSGATSNTEKKEEKQYTLAYAKLLAGCLKIHAAAIAVLATLYFSAYSSITLFNSGNLSFPRKLPSNIPNWNGDHV